MRRIAIFSLLVSVSLLASTEVRADGPNTKAKPRVVSSTARFDSTITLTPEMWLYLQERERYDNPKLAVRRNAERVARARQNRLIARRWFGMSNTRPRASCTPFTGTYSPYWSGNSSNPNQWIGGGGVYFPNYTRR